MPDVTLTISNTVATLSMNRSCRANALNQDMIRALKAHLQCLHRKDIAVLIIESNGKHFCTGADLQWLYNAQKLNAEDNYQDAKAFADVLDSIAALPMITIAKIQGYCLGGGVGIACACDYVIAEEESIFGCPEVTIGMVPAIITPYLIAKIGLQKTKEWFLLGAHHGASEAYAIQLVSKIAPTGTMDMITKQWIQQILKNTSKAITITKDMLHKCHMDGYRRIDFVDIMSQSRISADATQRIKQFLDKKHIHKDE